ncbi:cupin domain-containing protein [Chryseobacterium paridis]|uniref:Cupin domain-containing protein n=1 Tax=Chryseobacterium paridis TaxID=2800328 RepID=A0ABS1FST4_9FLAO|nr:cupin domain-containing protein [Chryseobacterium paridis]MBK1895493.1 cupin domain-containing protein [Chryseobacterium paridis]
MNIKLLSKLLLLCSLYGISAQAQSQNNVKEPVSSHAVILEQALKEKGFDHKAVEIMIVDFPPLGVSAAHRHPCPTFGYVLSGELVSVFEGKSHTYKAGDSFYETPEGLHNSTRNPSKTKPAKLLAFFIKDDPGVTIIPEKK